MKIVEKEYYVNDITYKYITLTNKNNMEITLSTCGAGIKEVKVPNKKGEVKTVTLAPIDDKEYNNSYHGKTIGRTSGRIENATFTIDGKIAHLEKNNFGIDNLHGGSTGFHSQNFDVYILDSIYYTDVNFAYYSPDGEGGYFGNIGINIIYRIYENENKFTIIIKGKSDCKNLLNVTNHVYWNLSGNLSSDVLEHELYINASNRAELNSRLIPTSIIPVTQEFNFKTPRKIKEFIVADYVQKYTKGYDHPFYLDSSEDVVASLFSKENDLRLNIKTSYPTVVCYTNNFPQRGLEVFKYVYDKEYLAVCLECQYSPNGINLDPENAGVFDKDDFYNEYIEYEFSY